MASVAPAPAGPPKPTIALSQKPPLGGPFWLLVAYFFLEYVRPQEYLPFLAFLKLGLILSIVLFLVWAIRGDKTVVREPLIVLYCLFVALVASTVIFAANEFWVFQMTKTLALYLIAATLPVTTFLANGHAIFKFFNLWIALHVVLAVIGIAQGGKGTGGFLEDANDLALALNMAIPYAFFIRQSRANSKRAKMLYLIALGILLVAVVVTQSRGGFVGLVVTTVGLLYFSRNRIRHLFVLGAIGLIVATLWLPKGYIADMQTITDTKESTADERLYSWRRSMDMFYDNPILGVGAGNWPWRVSDYEVISKEYYLRGKRPLAGRVAHSLYFTLIPELGLIGILLYSAIVVMLFKKLLTIARLSEDLSGTNADIDLALLARALVVSLLAFFSSGAFISVLYYPHFWYVIGFALALHYAAVKNSKRSLSSVTPKTPSTRTVAH